jgi:hypothetical protein
MNRLLTTAGLVLILASPAGADPLTGVAVFGGNSANIQNNVLGGIAASNGNVNVGPFVTVDGIAGGSASGGSGFVTVNGPITVNGDLTGFFGFAGTLNGPINTGGTANLNAIVLNNITSGGNVNLLFSSVTGNIRAGGNVSVAAFSSVMGSVTANGSVSGGPITGMVTQFAGVPVNPSTYTPITLTADKFTSGGSNVTTGGNLPPGSYGALNLPVFAGTLTLSAGNYFFDSINIAGAFTTLNFDLSKGPINVFVTGDITIGSFLSFDVNGIPAFINGVPNPAVEALASQIFFETLGNVDEGNPFGSGFFGTLFAPNGNITEAFGPIVGSLIAGGDVTNGFISPVFFVGSDRLLAGPAAETSVPEPSTLALGLVAALGLAGFCCWRRRAHGVTVPSR